MSWRLGLVDVCAILVLLVVLFMPGEDVAIVGAFDYRGQGDKARDVPVELARAGRLQTALYLDPGNGELATDYAEILSDLGRHDMALRIAGAASKIEGPTTWRAHAAVSAAFADRLDIPNALLWAESARDTCRSAGGVACPAHQQVRLRLYVEQLRLGMKALAKGTDPKFDPEGFRLEVSRGHPTVRAHTSK